jgi:endonuclease/exonuclease/phosphatase family metal-dependent hydrolase
MLRVCTWNIHLGLQLDNILGAISKHRDFAGLDLLALQEASVHGGRPDGAAIASVLGRGYECHQVARWRRTDPTPHATSSAAMRSSTSRTS